MALNKKQTIKKLIGELEVNPLLSRACSKLGVTRSTLYRWMDDEEVKEKIYSAQVLGRRHMNDFVESKLISNINNSHQRAIEFWLKHNSSRYANGDRALMSQIRSLEEIIKRYEIALLVANEDPYKEYADPLKLQALMDKMNREHVHLISTGEYKGKTDQEREAIELARKVLFATKLASQHHELSAHADEPDGFTD